MFSLSYYAEIQKELKMRTTYPQVVGVEWQQMTVSHYQLRDMRPEDHIPEKQTSEKLTILSVGQNYKYFIGR